MSERLHGVRVAFGLRSTVTRCVVLVVLVTGCSKDSATTQQAPAPSKADDLTRIEKAKKAACSNASVGIQLASPEHVEVLEAIKAASAHGFESDLGPLKELPSISASIASAQKELATQEPEKPEKPSYEKPSYSGARPIAGLCRGRYEGDQGIVIEARGKYYVVKDAAPCETPYVNGFIESTGETVTLALGRDGREAEVVVLKDRETYTDDQRSYRDEVAQAQADYQQAVKDYPQRVREWQDEVAASARKRQSAAAERDKLAAKWLTLLGCPADSAASTASSESASSARPTGVDPDCYGAGTVCNKARVKDAEALEELVGPAIEKAGWKCHQVRYLAGDGGGKDAISVEVPATCTTGLDYPSKAQLMQLANVLRRIVTRKPVATNVDLLQVTDGDDVDVQLPISASRTGPKSSAATDSTEDVAPLPTAAPPENRAAPKQAPSKQPPPSNTGGAGCDEVSCVLSNYDGACCAKFKKGGKPAGEGAPGGS